MADGRVRALERAWHASGVVADEVAYLRARLHTGAARRDRLELAAYLGYPPARALCGVAPPLSLTPWSSPWALRTWTRGLDRWPRHVHRRISLACCRRVLPVWEEACPDQPALRAAVEELEHALAGLRCDPAPWEALGAAMFPEADDAYAAAMAVFTAAPAPVASEDASAVLKAVVAYAIDAVGSAQAVLQAIRAEVVPWALDAGTTARRPGRSRPAARGRPTAGS